MHRCKLTPAATDYNLQYNFTNNVVSIEWFN